MVTIGPGAIDQNLCDLEKSAFNNLEEIDFQYLSQIKA